MKKNQKRAMMCTMNRAAKITTTLSSRIILIALYAVAITPLIIGTSYIFPMVFPKAMFAYACIGVALVGSIVWWSVHPPARPRADLFTATLIAYAAVLLAATIFAVNPQRALWSTLERMTGTVFLGATMLLSVMVATYFRVHAHHLQRYIQFLCGVSVLVAVGTIIQMIEPSALYNISHRPASTFGNPMYLGGYAATMLTLSIYGVYAWWRTSAVVLAVLAVVGNAISLTASASRGAIIATIAIACIAAGYAIRTHWNGPHRRAAQFGFGGLLLIALITGIITAQFAENEFLRTTTFKTRLIAWEIALRGAREHPVLGWGPEHFYYIFNKHYNPQSLLYGSYETWFDRAHSTPFELLATTGVVGLLAYLLQYGVLWWLALRRPTSPLLIACAAALGINFIQNLGAFDHPASFVLLYLIAGIIAAERTPAVQTPHTNTTRWLHWTAVVVAVVVAGGVAIFLFNMMKKNSFVLLGKSYVAYGNVTRASDMFTHARQYGGPYTDDILYEIGKAPVAQARDALEELLRRDPLHAQGQILYADVLATQARRDDTLAAQQALGAYERAAHMSPRRQLVYHKWALLLADLNQRAEALTTIQHAIDFEPTEPTSRWYAAVIAAPLSGARAVTELELALKLTFKPTQFSEYITIAKIYAQQQRYSEAALWIDRLLQISRPTDWSPQTAELGYDIALRAQRPDIQTKLDNLRAAPRTP